MQDGHVGDMPALSSRMIRLVGELDLHTAREMGATLSQAVGDVTRNPIVDLRAVTFMDSTALGALARAAEQMRNQGRALALLISPGQVRELLDVSGLADRFELLSAPPGGAGGSGSGPTAAA